MITDPVTFRSFFKELRPDDFDFPIDLADFEKLLRREWITQDLAAAVTAADAMRSFARALVRAKLGPLEDA